MSKEERREVEETGIPNDQEVVETIPTIEEVKVPWYKKLWNWFVGVIKPIVKIVCNGLQETVLYVINDAENQAAAQAAIKEAAKVGLKGSEAFKFAIGILVKGKINLSPTTFIAGGKVPKNILETLVQLVYTCIKNKLKKELAEETK